MKTNPHLSPATGSRLDHTDRKLKLGELFPKNQSIVNDRIRDYHLRNRLGMLKPAQYPKDPETARSAAGAQRWTPPPIQIDEGTGLSHSKRDSTRVGPEATSDAEVSSVDSEAERIKMAEYEEAKRVR